MPDMPHNTRAVDPVFSRPECIFCYCPHSDQCAERCQNPQKKPSDAPVHAPPHDVGVVETNARIMLVRLAAEGMPLVRQYVAEYGALERKVTQLTRERDDASAYTITLQRIIEAVCNGAALPSDAAEKAPHHAAMVSEYRARFERAREELQKDLSSIRAELDQMDRFAVSLTAEQLAHLDLLGTSAAQSEGMKPISLTLATVRLALESLRVAAEGRLTLPAPSTPGEEKANGSESSPLPPGPPPVPRTNRPRDFA